MDISDKLIRTLYALALEEEWNKFRELALEQAVRQLGAVAGAWLTQPDDQPGEFSAWPGQASVGASDLQSLAFKDDREIPYAAARPMLPGAKAAVAVRYRHQNSGLTSRVVLSFAGGGAPAPGVMTRIAAHMAEAYTLALQHFIMSDERLSRWGRANRGTAAMVDARGVIYAASRAFRELLGVEFGDATLSKMPFTMPADMDGEQSSFSQGTLRFRAVPAAGQHYLIYARKAQPLDGLSPREQEIARALSTGKTFKSVARQCGIATSTVANHASRIYRKLGIYRREELFEMIRANGQKSQPAA
jgi:DNA-binding CsgD family transcriptional regulator